MECLNYSEERYSNHLPQRNIDLHPRINCPSPSLPYSTVLANEQRAGRGAHHQFSRMGTTEPTPGHMIGALRRKGVSGCVTSVSGLGQNNQLGTIKPPDLKGGNGGRRYGLRLR